MSRTAKGLWRPAWLFAVLCIAMVVSAVLGYKLGYDSIPPVSVLYGATDVSWLARARVSAGAAVVLLLFIASFVLMSTYDKWENRLLRYRTFIFSAVLMTTAFWNITVMGLVVYGGVWHFMSFAIGLLEAIVSMTSIAILFITQTKALNDETNRLR